jgi:hypothetical protein
MARKTIAGAAYRQRKRGITATPKQRAARRMQLARKLISDRPASLTVVPRRGSPATQLTKGSSLGSQTPRSAAVLQRKRAAKMRRK